MTHSDSLKLPKKAEKKLLSQQANLGEKFMYDNRINTTWWSSPELKQDEFWEEVLCSLF